MTIHPDRILLARGLEISRRGDGSLAGGRHGHGTAGSWTATRAAAALHDSAAWKGL